MDEDLDQELQNLKSINSKKDNPEYKQQNNTSSPIFRQTRDYNQDSGTFNPDLKLVYSDTNNDSISIHGSRDFTLDPKVSLSNDNYKNINKDYKD